MKTVKDILRAKGSKVYSISPDATVYEALNRMADKHVRHLPVIEDEKIIGIISIGDVVKGVIDYKEFIIQEQ